MTGNTIFNWGVVPKLAAGIHEDSASHDDVITGNNVNYYETAAVTSAGQRTLSANNVGHPDTLTRTNRSLRQARSSRVEHA